MDAERRKALLSASHFGRSILASVVAFGESGISSSKIRALISAGKEIPEEYMHPDAAKHLPSVLAKLPKATEPKP